MLERANMAILRGVLLPEHEANFNDATKSCTDQSAEEGRRQSYPNMCSLLVSAPSEDLMYLGREHSRLFMR